MPTSTARHIRTLLLMFFYRQMYQLVAGGPRLRRPAAAVPRHKSKSKPYYVQTEEEMRTQLLDRGLADADASNRETTAALVEGDADDEPPRSATLAPRTAKKRSSPWSAAASASSSHAERARRPPASCPIYHVYPRPRGTLVHHPWRARRLRRRGRRSRRQTRSSTSATPPRAAAPQPAESHAARTATPRSHRRAGHGRPAPSQLHIIELHEVRTINTAPRRPQPNEFGFDTRHARSRRSAPAARNPATSLRRGENEAGLEDLRGLPAAIRDAGRKGPARSPASKASAK